MLSPKQAFKTGSWANPLWWDNFMNGNISVMFFYHGTMTSLCMYMWAIQSLWYVRTLHMCHHLQHIQNISMCRSPFLRSLTSFIISVCEMSSQNILKLITFCGKHCVVSYINNTENPDACVCVSLWSPVRVHGKRKWPASSDRYIHSTVVFQCCIPVISLLLTINFWQTSRLN